MTTSIILVFIIGYLLIVFEHPLKLDKTVSALLTGSILWAFLALGFHNGGVNVIDSHGHLYNTSAGITEVVEEGFTATLLHHIGKIAEILIF